MHTELMLYMQDKDPEKLVAYIDNLNNEKFSLVSIIDSLVPELVMESNLRFGSFHLIKMSLFLRNLSLRGVLSRETEIALAKVVVQHLYYLEWIKISASPFSHAPDPVNNSVSKMLAEIGKGNAQNAYFYADVALHSAKDKLLNALLRTGTTSIPDTLGHSLSCFFPVIEEIVAMNHTASGTALLSYIMYLCRFRKTGSLPDKAEASLQVDRDRLLQQAASGTTIVDIHHMITCYIFLTWEKSALYDKQPLPWSLLAEWIGSKSVDNNRMSFILSYIGEDIAPEDKIPSDYEQWKSIFASRDKKKITAITLSLLRRSWKQTCDWLFRAYADYYTPDWDPHYYTSLYAALEMYHDQSVNKTGSSMAVVQALEYFLSNI